MNNYKTIAILILRGSEFRSLLYSGLCDRLSKSFRIRILSQIRSQSLEQFCERNNFQLHYIEEYSPEIVWKNLLSSISKYRLAYLGYRLYQHKYSIQLKSRLKKLVLGNALFYQFFWNIFIWKNRNNVFSSKAFFLNNPCNGIILLNSSSSLVSSIIQFCYQSRIRVFAIQNSVKDFYINASIHPGVSAMFTWNSFFCERYAEFNSQLRKTKVVASGYPAYACINSYQPVQTLQFYAATYGFDYTAKIILYTCINPAVYDCEVGIINFVSKALKDIDPKIILLVRPNPMDSTGIIDNLRLSNVRILKRGCTYDLKHDSLFCPQSDGEEYFDLLYYSTLVITIPSTVTVEAYFFNRNIVSICFDEGGSSYEPFRAMYESEFYRPLHNASIDANCANKLPEVLRKALNYRYREPQLIESIGTAEFHSRSIDVIATEVQHAYADY